MVGFVGSVLPELRLLAGQVPLIFWDQGDSCAQGALTIENGGVQVAAPILTLSAPLEGGGTRIVLAFAATAGAIEDITVKQNDGTVVCSLEGERQGAALLESATLLASLSDAGRVRVVRFLLQTCRTAFGLSEDEVYIDNIRRLVDELSLRPSPMEPLCLLDKRFFLAAGSLPAPVGANPVALMIGAEAVRQSPVPPVIDRSGAVQNKRQTVMVPLHRSVLLEGGSVVVMGSTGIAIRSVKAPSQSLEAAVSWLVTQKRLPITARDYVLQCLTQLGQEDTRARDAVREVLVIGEAGNGEPKSGVKSLVHIDCAISLSDSLFLSGSINDPHGILRSIDVVVGSWSVRIDRSSIHPFGASRTDRETGNARSVAGFVVLAGGQSPAPLYGAARVSLTLASGATMDLTQVPLLLAGAVARDAILNAVPASAMTETLLSDTLMPAIDLVQSATDVSADQRGDPIEFGTQSGGSAVSLVMPIGSDLGLTKTWSAALGGGILCDSGFELIVVAPSEEVLTRAERVLGGLHRQFGIASRLVSAPLQTHARSALAAGVDAATRDTILFLDYGCLPANRKALDSLVAAATRARSGSLVGGVLLDPAGSILHAGFTPPQDNMLGCPHEGFPAPQLDGLPAQPVFACSTSFLAMARSDFDAIGGFSPAFLTRDWADADFCLKARANGCDVRVEDQSRITCYAAGRSAGDADPRLASRVDAHRFSRDWHQEVAAWPAGNGGAILSEPPSKSALSRSSIGNPRWAA